MKAEVIINEQLTLNGLEWLGSAGVRIYVMPWSDNLLACPSLIYTHEHGWKGSNGFGP